MKRMLPLSLFKNNQPPRHLPWSAAFLFMGMMFAGINVNAQDCDPSGVSQAAVVCDGGLANFVVAGLAPGETYDVDFDTDGGGPDGTAFTLFANPAGEVVIQVTMTAADAGATFTVTSVSQTTGTTCTNAVPLPTGIVSTTVQVNEIPSSIVVTTLPASPICLNSTIAHQVAVTPATPNSGAYTYLWRACNLFGATTSCNNTGFSGSGDSVMRQWTFDGNKSVGVTVSIPGCPDQVNNFDDFVVSTTTAITVANSTENSVCSGATLNIDPTNNVTGSTAGWTFNWSTPSALTGTASGTGNITGTTTNTGSAQANIVYTVAPTSAACNSTAFTVTQPVDPAPVGSPSVAGDTICPTETPAATYTLTTGDAFNVTAVASSGNVTGFTATQNNLTSGTAIETAAISSSDSSFNTITYTITPYSYGFNGTNDNGAGDDCLGTTSTYTVVVQPEPRMQFDITSPATVLLNAGNTDLTATVCNGTTVSGTASTVNFVTPTAGSGVWVKVDITDANDFFGLGGTGTYHLPIGSVNFASVSMTTTGAVNETVSATLTPYIETNPAPGAMLDAGECTSTPLTFNITILPTPASTPSAMTEDVCSGNAPMTMVALNPGDKYLITSSVLSGTVTGNTASTTKNTGDAIEAANLINTTDTDAVVRYIITPYNFGTDTNDDSATGDDCLGENDTVLVTVYPTPNLTFSIAGVILNDGNTVANINICDSISNVPVTAIAQGTSNVISSKVGVRFEATGTDLFLGPTALTGTPLVVEDTLNAFNATPLWANQPLALRLANSSLSTPQTATFIITPFYDENEDGILNNGECEGTPYTANITVNPTPQVQWTVNGTTVTADNDLNTPNVYSFKLCDTANNVSWGDIAELISTPDTRILRTSTKDNIVGFGPDVDDDIAGWNANKPTEFRLRNARSDEPGFIVFQFTPYNDTDNSGDFSPGDCAGEVIEVRFDVYPVPAVEIDVNGVTVTSDLNNGGNAVAYVFDLCKGGANNITLDNLNEINETDSTRIQIEVLMNTNTTGDAMGTIDDQDVDDITASLPLSTTLSAVNTALPGIYKLAITPYRESGDAAGLDAMDCAGETDTVTFNVVSSPEVSIIVNNTTVTADNDLGTNDNAYTFDLCDVDNNLDLSAIATVVNSPNTFIRTEVSVNNNVAADPQATIVSQPLAFFQGQLPATTELRLVNSADSGQYTILITPFFESGDQAGLDANDCEGEQISVTFNIVPAPSISVDINGNTLSTNNNGQRDVSETDTLTVCNGTNNVTFSNLSQTNSSPDAALTIAFTTVTNVTVDGAAPAGVTSPLSPLVTLLGTPQSVDVELVNAGTPGLLEGYFLAFTDGPNGAPNNTLDNGECTADTLWFSVTVNPRPEISMTVNGAALDNVGTVNQTPDGNETINLTVCHRLDSVVFSTITNTLGVANVGVQAQISGSNVNIGLPLPLSLDEKLGLFNAQLPALSPVGLNLVDSSLQGTLTFILTPFDDVNDNGDLDVGECMGDPLTVNVTVEPIPFLSIDVNGMTVQTDNDSSTAADRRDTIIVCNVANNFALSPISRVNGVSLGANDWVQINVVTASNVNNPLGTTSITSSVDALNGGPLNGGLLASLSLVNPAVEGFYSLEIIPFNNNGTNPTGLDADDCRGEGGILTVRVGTVPADLSQDFCPGNDPNCGRIQIRYCQNEANPDPLSSFIAGPNSTNPTYETGDTLRWYAAASGGSPIAEPTPDLSVLTSETYWVTQVNPVTGCESLNRTEVRATKRREATLTVNQPAGAVCEGDTLDLFAQIASSAGNPNLNAARQLYLYGQGSTAASANSLGQSTLAGPSPVTTADPNNNVYWIYRLDNYGINPQCSSDTLSVTYNVNSAPVVNANAAALGCKGDTIFLSEDGGAATGWSWTGPASYTSSQQNDTIANATAANIGRYYVTVVDGNSCTNTDSVDVSFQTTFDLTLNVSDTSYCPPAPATAEITVELAEAGVSYIIEELPSGTPLDTLIGTGTDLTFMFPMPAALTYYQIVAEDGGCRDTLMQQGSVLPIDTLKPVLTCPADIDVIANASCVTLADYTALATVVDNCATGLAATAQFPPAAFTIQDTTTVTLFADDGNGNVGECTFDVNVVDNTPPVIGQCPPNQITNVNANCQGVIINFVPTVVVTDNCDPAPAVVQTPGPGTLVGLGVQSVSITATDYHGQSSVCNFTVTVQDQTPPTISCPSDTTIGLSIFACNAILPDYRGLVNGNDNCSGSLTPTQSPAAGTLISGHGTVTTITMTVTDGTNPSASCTFDVTAIDTFPPSVTGPITQTIYRTAACEATLPDWTATGLPLGFANDACDGFFLAQTQSPPAGTKYFIDTTFVVTLFATDAAGNIGSASFNVTVADTAGPAIVCPQNDTVSVDVNCNYLLGSYAAISASDNCGPATVTQSPAAGITVNANQTITLTATDSSSNSTSCTFEVVLEDNTPPAIICPGNQMLTANAQCNFLLPDYSTSGVPSDNCGVASVAQTPLGGSVLLLGANAVQNVTLTVEDNAGNSAACSFTVTLIDLSLPTITTCAPDTVIYADASCNATLGDYRSLLVADDNCGSPSLIYDQAPASGFPIIAGANSNTVVVLTATDASGNQASCQFNVTVLDTIAPSVVCPPADTVSTMPNSCVAQLPDYTGILTATDNCGIQFVNQSYSFADTAVVLTASPQLDSLFIWDRTSFSLIRKIQLSTSVGNILGVTAMATNPVSGDIYAVLRTGIPVSGGSSSVFNLTTLDPQTGILSNIGVLNGPFNSITFDPNGRLFGMTNQYDFANSISEALYEIDPGTAGITLLANIGNYDDGEAIAFNGDDGFLYHLSGYGGVGNIIFERIDTASFAKTLIPLPASGLPDAFTQLLYIGSGQFIVTGFNSVPNYAFYSLTSGGAVASLSPNYNGVPMKGIVESVLSGSNTGPVTFSDSIVVEVVAVDGSGNTDTCSFVVFAADSTAPVIACMGDTLIDADANCEGQVPDFSLSSVSATDNCDTAVVITQSIVAGTNFSDSIDVELVAMDDFGNTDTCVVTVRAIDNTPPVVTCPLPQQIPADAICQAILPNYVVSGLAFATDNCTPIDTIYQNPVPGNVLLGLSTFPITITARDTFGNVGTCMFTVTTIDTTAPSILCATPPNATIVLDGNCEEIMPDYTGLATAVDNCSNSPAPVITQSPLAGSTLSGAGNQTVFLTATDNDNNSSQCSFTIVLEDTLAPVINCASDTTVYADANCQFTMIDMTFRATVTDNCDQPVITQSPAVASSIALGTTTVKIFATDLGGNVDSCDFVLTVADTTSPVITCPSDTIAVADVNCQANLADYTSLAVVTDNCSQSASVLQFPLPGELFGTGTANGDTVTVILTAIDTATNQGFCSFKVVKRDTTPPSITCPSVTYTVTADAFCNGKLADYRPVVVGSISDNCSPVNAISLTQSPDSGTFIGGVGNSQVVTMTATDEAGNAANCTITVTVVDLTPPSFTCPNDTVVYVDTNCDVFNPDFASNIQATDNCGSALVTQFPIAGITINGHNNAVNVKLYVADGSGNVDSSCIVTVTAIDTLPPTFTCPATDTVDVLNTGGCSAPVPDYTSLIAADNCALSVTITQTPTAASLFSVVDTATVYFDDGNGNIDSCEIRLVVGDTIPPSISCPNDTTVYADATCFWESIAFDTLSTFSTADNCDPNPTILQAPLAGALYGKGVTPVTLVSTDAFNNSRFCVFNVTVSDTTGPAITCPTDRILFANPICQAILPDYTSLTTAFDNCDGTRTVTQSLPAGINVTGGGGPIAITMSASDASGNTSTCAFNVILADNIGPDITGCPNDTIVYLDNNCEYVLADFRTLITAVDGCGGGVTMSQVPAPGGLYSAGTQFTLTIVAADAANNQNTCAFQVTVADSTKPTIGCSPITILLDQSGNYTLDADDIAAITNGSTDNCTDSAGLSRFIFPNIFSCADIGTPVNVLASVGDASFNISTCTTLVTVKPTPMSGIAEIFTPDTAICEGEIIPLRASAAGIGQSGLWTLSTTGTFTPNDQDSLADLSSLPAGVHELVWTITDQCMASADTITITVNERPEVVASEIVSISAPGASDGQVEAVTISGTPTAWEWSNSAPSNDTAFNLSAGTYWVIATDVNGCTSDTSFVTLFDPAISGVSVNVRVALEGPYDDGTQRMNDFLRQASLLPTTDPYGMGATVAASRLTAQANADEDIVDWVHIQLYDTVGTGNDGYGSLAGEQAALLRRDGFVVDPVTNLPLIFNGLANDNYHVIVKHRNHIALGSDASISLSNTVVLVDFFNGAVAAFSGVANTSTSGKVLMISGNTNGDGQIDGLDIFIWSGLNGTFNVYNSADLDMNGQVDALDPFNTWVGNNGKFTTLP